MYIKIYVRNTFKCFLLLEMCKTRARGDNTNATSISLR